MTGPVVSLTLFAAIGNNTTGTVLQWYTVLATAAQLVNPSSSDWLLLLDGCNGSGGLQAILWVLQ